MGAAHRFLERHRERPSFLPVTAWSEFAEGFTSTDDPVFRSLVDSFEILALGEQAASHYAQITRVLRRRGKLIGANDLWIAALARAHALPLITRNTADFSRVPDLVVQGYA